MREHYCSAPDSPLSERNFSTDPQLRRNCAPSRQYPNRSWRASQQDQQPQRRVIVPSLHQLHYQSHGYFNVDAGSPYGTTVSMSEQSLSRTSLNSNLMDCSAYAGGPSLQTTESAYQPPPPYPGVPDLVSSMQKLHIRTPL